MDKPLNVVLLLAGGHGFRMHTDRPKQFIEIAGEPVISYTPAKRSNAITKSTVLCGLQSGMERFCKNDGSKRQNKQAAYAVPGRRH